MPEHRESTRSAPNAEAAVEAVEPPDATPATAASPESADSGGQEANRSGFAADTALQEELAARQDDEDAGFFARIGNAFKGFFRGLRGLPVEIPLGEEGTIPVAKAAASQRKLKKRLARAQAKLDELRESLEQRNQELAERDAALREAALEEARKRGDATRRCEDLEQELARWRTELAARDETIAEMRAQMTSTSERSKTELDETRGELQFTKSTLAEKESALDLLLGEVKNQEAEIDREREGAARRQEQLRAEIEDGRRKLVEAESAAHQLRSELSLALPPRAEAEGLRAKAAHVERDLAKKSEEADLLREDLIAQRRRAAEMDERAKQAGEFEAQKASFQRESQRLSVQAEALRDQFTEARLKLEKLSTALREFHGPAVSALQAAAVYSESLAGSLAMNETDRSDTQELKRSVELLRQTMQKLAAKLAELGIPHS
ncbi:MAG: hypothetical protein ACRD6I_06760 [Candidatus Acidiferrales bacterium]